MTMAALKGSLKSFPKQASRKIAFVLAQSPKNQLTGQKKEVFAKKGKNLAVSQTPKKKEVNKSSNPNTQLLYYEWC